MLSLPMMIGRLNSLKWWSCQVVLHECAWMVHPWVHQVQGTLSMLRG
jgi:hypothetical protein